MGELFSDVDEYTFDALFSTYDSKMGLTQNKWQGPMFMVMMTQDSQYSNGVGHLYVTGQQQSFMSLSFQVMATVLKCHFSLQWFKKINAQARTFKDSTMS